MDVRTPQEPLKAGYRDDPARGRITRTARGGQVGQPMGCSIDVGRAQHAGQAHAGVGDLDRRGTLGRAARDQHEPARGGGRLTG